MRLHLWRPSVYAASPASSFCPYWNGILNFSWGATPVVPLGLSTSWQHCQRLGLIKGQSFSQRNLDLERSFTRRRPPTILLQTVGVSPTAVLGLVFSWGPVFHYFLWCPKLSQGIQIKSILCEHQPVSSTQVDLNDKWSGGGGRRLGMEGSSSPESLLSLRSLKVHIKHLLGDVSSWNLMVRRYSDNL